MNDKTLGSSGRFGDDIDRWLADPSVQRSFEEDALEGALGTSRAAHMGAFSKVLASAQANGAVTNQDLFDMALGLKGIGTLGPGLLLRAERLYEEERFEAEAAAQQDAGAKARARCSSALGAALLRPAMAAAAGSMIRAWERAVMRMGGPGFVSSGERADLYLASAAKSLVSH
jgi:hypothetical protein